jgi:hypothetical protein
MASAKYFFMADFCMVPLYCDTVKDG